MWVVRPGWVEQLARRHQRQPVHRNTTTRTPMLSTIERPGSVLLRSSTVFQSPLWITGSAIRQWRANSNFRDSSAMCPPAVEHTSSVDPVARHAPRIPWRWQAQSVKSNYIHHKVNTYCPDRLVKTATNEQWEIRIERKSATVD